MKTNLKINDSVKLKNPLSELEKSYIFRIDNINDVTNRILITALNSDLSIAPTELVSLDDVQEIFPNFEIDGIVPTLEERTKRN